MTPQDNIPTLLKGRGAKSCLSIKCDCGTQFLWTRITTPEVICPSCRRTETLTVDAPVLNGQLK